MRRKWAEAQGVTECERLRYKSKNKGEGFSQHRCFVKSFLKPTRENSSESRCTSFHQSGKRDALQFKLLTEFHINLSQLCILCECGRNPSLVLRSCKHTSVDRNHGGNGTEIDRENPRRCLIISHSQRRQRARGSRWRMT